MRTVLVVRPGKPAPPAVKVIVSRSADQIKLPPVAGVNEKAIRTEFVSIGLLNWSTICADVDAFVFACDGLWLMTTGSSDFNNDRAMKIFADVPGTVIGGVVGVEVTVMVSFVFSRFTST